MSLYSIARNSCRRIREGSFQAEELEAIPSKAFYEDEDHWNWSSDEKGTADERYRKVFADCRGAARKARENLDNNVSEDAWQFFMNHYIFSRYQESRPSLLEW